MFRYALKIEYDGSNFHGWQKQKNLETVQGAINKSIKFLDPYSEGVTGAGRTDTGVHATGQVGHVDLNRKWDAHELRNAINYHLKPNLIAIIDVVKVSNLFHSRFSAMKRTYLYKIFSRAAPLTLEKNRSWYLRQPLNREKMIDGASYLIGSHDFTTFRSSLCQAKSPLKSIEKISIAQRGYLNGSIIEINIEAKSFLHNQVRSIAGTLEKVGSGHWPPEKVGEVLAAKNRSACGPVAPAAGLYLTKVDYSDKLFQS